MVQWIRNPTAVAQVTVESEDPIPGLGRSLRGACVAEAAVKVQQQLGISPWPGSFHMPWVWPLKKKKNLHVM